MKTSLSSRRVLARGTGRAREAPAPAMLEDPTLVVLVYAPAQAVAKWVDVELERDGALVQVARTMAGLVRSLTEDPASRPHVLVVDLDAISAVELIELHEIRQAGWFGSIIALGKIPPALRASLGIDHALSPPYTQDQLRDAIAVVRVPPPTRRIPILRDVR